MARKFSVSKKFQKQLIFLKNNAQSENSVIFKEKSKFLQKKCKFQGFKEFSKISKFQDNSRFFLGIQQIEKTTTLKTRVTSAILNKIWKKNSAFLRKSKCRQIVIIHTFGRKLESQRNEFVSFWPSLKVFGKVWFALDFSKYLEPGNFVEFQAKYEIGEKTLFSKACIFSIFYRICMKSWLWERLNSVVFDLCTVKLRRV